MVYAGVVKSHVVLFYRSSSGFYYFIVQVLVFSRSWCVSFGFGGGNPHVKYLCAVANFCDEYYLVIGPFCIFFVHLSTRRVTPLTRVFNILELLQITLICWLLNFPISYIFQDHISRPHI